MGVSRFASLNRKPAYAAIIALALLCGCSKDRISPIPVQTISASRLVLDKAHSDSTIYVKNTGQAPLTWSLQISDAYLSSSVTQGIVNPGDSVAITITADFDKTEDQSINNTQVLFNFPETFDQHITVFVVDFTETKWHFSSSIVDAEYDKAIDAIVVLGHNPDKLLIVDPVNRTTKELALDFPGSWLSVSPDGTHALIGHSAAISYIDLDPLKVQKTIGLPFDFFDGVLSDSVRAYLFPGNTQWTNVLNIDLTTEDEHFSWTDTFGDSHGKLSPSGASLFVMTTLLYPPTIDRYNLDGGLAKVAYFSLWGGDNAMGDNFWLSGDGLKFYANSGNVFWIVDNPNQPLVLKTKLQGTDYGISAFDYSSAAQRTYLVNYSTGPYDVVPGNVLAHFDLSDNYLGSETLESFVTTDRFGTPVFADALGYFLFIDSAGTRVHVLQKASGIAPEQWAIQSFTVK